MSPYKRRLKRIRKRIRGKAKARTREALQPIFDKFVSIPKDPLAGLLAGLESSSTN